jgi:hypothetical protein
MPQEFAGTVIQRFALAGDGGDDDKVLFVQQPLGLVHPVPRMKLALPGRRPRQSAPSNPVEIHCPAARAAEHLVRTPKYLPRLPLPDGEVLRARAQHRVEDHTFNSFETHNSVFGDCGIFYGPCSTRARLSTIVG